MKISSHCQLFRIDINSKKNFIDNIKRTLRSKKNKTTVFNYLNVGTFFYIFSDQNFTNYFNKNSLVYLNSFFIGCLLKILYRKEIAKLNAEDFFFDALKICEESRKKVYLLGSSELGVKNALSQVKKNYPKLQIKGYNGYFYRDQEVIKKIKKFNPSILFVAMGQYNQEKWIYNHFDKLQGIKIIITIGNFIDILGNEKKLPHVYLKKYNLEWLYRLIKEPKRLWKRYSIGLLVTCVYFSICLLSKGFRKFLK